MGVRRHNGGLCGTLWGTYNDFWQDTSISAVSNAGKAKTSPYIRRFVWLIIFIFFFALTIKNVVDLTYEYRNYPVTYSLYVENEKKVQPKSYRYQVLKLPSGMPLTTFPHPSGTGLPLVAIA